MSTEKQSFLGNYLGIVIMNSDPEKRGRLKIWVPHISTTVYENWNKDKKDRNFIFPDATTNPDLTDILPELKRLLPWAECASPLFGGSASGRYNAIDRKGTTSDSNYWEDDNRIFGKRPSEMFKEDYPDAFTESNNVLNRFVNPYSHQYKPGPYSNLARGVFTIPNVGAHVWVFFQEGDPRYPVYFAASHGQEDWKRIYTLNQSNEEPDEDFGAPDYPQSYENVDVQDAGILSTDTKTFRAKTVFNSNKHTIELVDTDLREVLKLTHFTGSFLEFNNVTTTRLAAGNDQLLVTGDQFLTVKKNQSSFVQDHREQITGGDIYEIVGQFDLKDVKDIYKILKDIHDRKRLFEIKRTSAFEEDVCGYFYPNAEGVSPLQARSGGEDVCPTCCGGKPYNAVFNIRDLFELPPCSPGLIDPMPHFVEIGKTGACGDKWVRPCRTCCGSGISPSTQDGAWAAEGLRLSLPGYIHGKQLELFPIQRKLGNGGNKIISIHGNKIETIGQVINDFRGWRVDPRGKIRVAGVQVDDEGTYEYMHPAPIVEYVDVDNMPGGDYTLTASSKYRLLVGGGGVHIKTYGNIEMFGGIVTVAGEQVNLSSKGEVLVSGASRVSLQGRSVSLNPDNYGHAVANGGFGVTRNLTVNGGAYIEGELYTHHITAPLEFQTTECADSLKCATLPPCFPPPVPVSVVCIGGLAWEYSSALQMWAWLLTHTHIMPPHPHFHYFKNVPLDLWDTSIDVRIDAVDSGINTPLQMAAKPVRTPIPNCCDTPWTCFGGVPCFAESIRIVDNVPNSGGPAPEPLPAQLDNLLNKIECGDAETPAETPEETTPPPAPSPVIFNEPSIVNDTEPVVQSFRAGFEAGRSSCPSGGGGGGGGGGGDSSLCDVVFVLDTTSGMNSNFDKLISAFPAFTSKLDQLGKNVRMGAVCFGDNYGVTNEPITQGTTNPEIQTRPFIAPLDKSYWDVFKAWLQTVKESHIYGGEDINDNAIDAIDYARASSQGSNPEGSYQDDASFAFNYTSPITFILLTNAAFHTPTNPGNSTLWYADGVMNTYTEEINKLLDSNIKCYTITQPGVNETEYRTIAEQTSAQWFDITTSNYQSILEVIAEGVCYTEIEPPAPEPEPPAPEPPAPEPEPPAPEPEPPAPEPEPPAPEPEPGANTRYILQGTTYTQSNNIINSMNVLMTDDDREIYELLKKQNVTTVFRGTKFVAGVDTKEPCIVVGVKQKISSELLDENDLIPQYTKNNKKTDVIEFPEIYANMSCNNVNDPQLKYRPIRGGVTGMISSSTGGCTLGCIVKDSTDKTLVMLSNNHCNGLIYDDSPTSSVGTPCIQPSRVDGGNLQTDLYGEVKRILPFSRNDVSIADCSISSITSLNPTTDILNMGQGPFLFETNRNNYGSGTICKKVGRTTNCTEGIVDNTTQSIIVNYSGGSQVTFLNQILVKSTEPFSLPGDSGSAVLANINGVDKIIGLLYASTSGRYDNPGHPLDGFYLAFVNHISDVASALQIENWQGDVVVAQNASPQITINGKIYTRYGNTDDPITHEVV